MAEQLELFPEDPAQDKAADKEKVAKARARAAENEEFKDKRVKSSPLIQQAEVAKMREILAKPRAEKPEQARMKYGNPVMEAAQLKNDVLSLSDEDFGSKYGRDRTAKEVATKDANDRAGYKEAEADYKKEQAQAKKAGYASAEAEEKALREKATSRTRGGGGGGIPLDKMDKMKKMNYRTGGSVRSSASKRADGCAQRGKTKGRMV